MGSNPNRLRGPNAVQSEVQPTLQYSTRLPRKLSRLPRGHPDPRSMSKVRPSSPLPAALSTERSSSTLRRDVLQPATWLFLKTSLVRQEQEFRPEWPGDWRANPLGAYRPNAPSRDDG